MDKESIFELQKIDTNCNDCIFMQRDLEKHKRYDYLHEGQINASHRLNYGICNYHRRDVSFIPGNCMPQNANCFLHRKEIK